jgi:Mycothiol maleylpyruvate isomerase N-terminal domain
MADQQSEQQAERMTKADVIEKMRAGRAEWEALLAQVPRERMTEPGVMGEWSLKDIIAHVSWGELEIAEVFRQHALVGSDLWNLPQDERNAAMVAESHARSLDDVLAEAERAYPQLLAAVQTLDDEDFNDAARYAGMPPLWRPWQLIAGNTYDHYPEHIPAIRAWLDQAI